MKKIPILFLSVALLLSPGCASLNNPTTAQRVQSAAKIAAYVGTTEYVRAHPETKPAFVIARDELRVLATAEALDFATLLAVINKLPVKEIKNERATMVITVAGLLLSDYAGSLPVDRLATLQPVAAAIASGIDLGLNPSP